MEFLHEKQVRNFCIFLLAYCILLFMGLAVFCSIHEENMKSAMLERESAVASELLVQNVAPEVIAAALGSERVTEEGKDFLRSIGHTGQTRSSFFSIVKEKAAVLYHS